MISCNSAVWKDVFCHLMTCGDFHVRELCNELSDLARTANSFNSEIGLEHLVGYKTARMIETIRDVLKRMFRCHYKDETYLIWHLNRLMYFESEGKLPDPDDVKYASISRDIIATLKEIFEEYLSAEDKCKEA